MGGLLAGSVSILQKSKKGASFINIPEKIVKDLKLRPVMAGQLEVRKNIIKIFGFEKTVKMKVDLERKTIKRLKIIMEREGYGSLDETVSNIVHRQLDGEKATHIVYLYPEGFLNSKFVLINDYEKSVKTKGQKRGK